MSLSAPQAAPPPQPRPRPPRELLEEIDAVLVGALRRLRPRPETPEDRQ